MDKMEIKSVSADLRVTFNSREYGPTREELLSIPCKEPAVVANELEAFMLPIIKMLRELGNK